MSQKTLHSFFVVKKRPADQHAAKKRKVLLQDNGVTSKAGDSSKALLKIGISCESEKKEKTPLQAGGDKVEITNTKSSTLDQEKLKACEKNSVKSQVTLTSVVTSIKDGHTIPPILAKPVQGSNEEKRKPNDSSISELLSSSDVCPLLSTPSSSTTIEAKNTRTRKRDTFGQNKEEESNDSEEATNNSCVTRFTIGKYDSPNSNMARRKLHMEGAKSVDSTKRAESVSSSKKVTFTKAGILSPTKQNVMTSANVPFEKKGALSPVKKPLEANTINEKSDGQKEIQSVQEAVEKLTPTQIKAKIGKVRKLADLKAHIQALNKDKVFANTGENKHRRALFSPSKLSKEAVTFEVEAPKQIQLSASPVASPVKSGQKASPRKPVQSKYRDLQPDKYMPLPRKYNWLAEVFRCVDVIVGMKFNRREIIRVADIKPAVQNMIRKTFGEHYLRQIRCVFPKAYHYTWDKILDRLGRHTSGDYELQMSPNMNYNEPDDTSSLDNERVKGNIQSKMSPRDHIEREKIVKHSLLQIAKDCHQDFLKSRGFEVDQEKLTKWYTDFDPEEHCPDIDTVDLPPKPHVEKMTNAKDMLEKLAGVNPRLESVLQQQEKSLQLAEKGGQEEENGITTIKNAEQMSKAEKPKIRKELRNLPKSVIEKILANEKAKQIREMTQNTEERKELEMMQELILVAPYIVNCHRSQRKGAAVKIDILTKVTADSFGRGKTKEEMVKLLSMFLRLVPECMEIKTYDRIEYVKHKKDSPDINAIRSKIQKLVDEQKQS